MRSNLSSKIDNEIKVFYSFLTKRLKNERQLDWLTHNPEQFKPDYLQISTIGSKKYILFLNKYLSKYLPFLWKKLIWKRIYKTIIAEIKRKYSKKLSYQLKKNSLEQNTCNDYINDYFFILEKHFSSAPKSIREATFTEVFTFISKTLFHFAVEHDISPDFFKQEKEIHNNACIEIRNELRPYYKNNLEILIYLVIRSNWIDIVEDNVSLFIETFKLEVNEILDNQHSFNLHKRNTLFYQIKTMVNFLTSKPKHILYELDNSGEVIFDLELVSFALSLGHKVTLVAKEHPVLNDITEMDIHELLRNKKVINGLNICDKNKLKIISSGCKSTGKMTDYVSEKYVDAYTNCDAQIIKGQGNFQTMPMGIVLNKKFKPNQYKKPIFFLMGIKAPMIEQSLKSILKEEYILKQELFLYYYNAEKETTFPFNLSKNHTG